MTATGQEIEVKFYVCDLAGLQQRLLEQGAVLELERVHEINLRFDTGDRALFQAGQVLRLRQDTEARITFKGPGQVQAGARLSRFEIAEPTLNKIFLDLVGPEAATAAAMPNGPGHA